MKKDYKKAIHLDFHTMPGIYDINELDTERIAETLKNANVEYVNIVAECNIGFSYYPTKIGRVYPGLKRDLLGGTLDACHKRNIGVTAYVNGGINNANLIEHPEWLIADKSGKTVGGPVVDGYDNYCVRKGCFNTGYASFMKEIFKEIVSNYDVDGIFCDCMMFHTPCYCEKCKADMKARGIDIGNTDAVIAFADEQKEKFANEIKNMVGDRIHTFFNSMPWDASYQDHIELECLPNDTTWSYDYFLPFAARAATLGKEVCYMTGRFQTSWGDFGGICSKQSLENDMFDAIMRGFGFSVGDHCHPSKGLIKLLYDTIGDIYADLAEYQKHTEDCEYVADIGVITPCRISDMWMHMGLARMLSELKYSFNIISAKDDFSSYKLLILCDGLSIDGKIADKINEFVADGGKVLSYGSGGTDKNGRFVIKTYGNVIEYCGIDQRKTAFFRLEKGIIDEYNDINLAVYKPASLIKCLSGEKIALDVGLYFDKHFDGDYNYLYIPPEKTTEYAAAVIDKNFAHFSFDIFEGYEMAFFSAYRKLVGYILKRLLPDPVLRAEDLPVFTRASVLHGKDRAILNIKTTFPESKLRRGSVDEHVSLPAGPKVSVRGEYKHATEAKSGRAITTDIINGYTEIVLPEITGFKLIVLER